MIPFGINFNKDLLVKKVYVDYQYQVYGFEHLKDVVSIKNNRINTLIILNDEMEMPHLKGLLTRLGRKCEENNINLIFAPKL